MIIGALIGFVLSFMICLAAVALSEQQAAKFNENPLRVRLHGKMRINYNLALMALTILSFTITGGVIGFLIHWLRS